jgi:hypothetical protein
MKLNPKINLPKPSKPKLRMPRLGGPEIRMPKLSKPKLRAPKLGGPQINLPPFVNNLYRDMRDRRLLLPAVGLLIALLAVPILLKHSSSSSSPPPSTGSASSEKTSAAQPAVVTQQLGVTNYKKRLEQFKSKNPFRQQFTAVPKSAKLNTTSTASSTSSITTSTGSTSSTLSPSSSSSSISSSTPAPSPLPSPSTGGSATPAIPPTPSSRHTSAPTPKPPESQFFIFHAALAIGPAGELTKRNAVKEFTFLPSYSKPMVAFLGVHGDLEHAIFAISDDVSSVSDGQCLPKRSKCTFLVLQPGQTATLKYAPEGDRTYKLRLIGLHLQKVEKPQGKTSGKRAQDQPQSSQVVNRTP